MTREEKLILWMEGELDDDDLTNADIRELEKRVFDAVARKVLERPGVHSFAQHSTVQ